MVAETQPEWLYRLLKEPKRMWKRYIIGNTLFLWNGEADDEKSYKQPKKTLIIYIDCPKINIFAQNLDFKFFT